jgi:hypothetical protein
VEGGWSENVANQIWQRRFAIPLGFFIAGKAEITLVFIGAAVLFLTFFVFLPKLIQYAIRWTSYRSIRA